MGIYDREYYRDEDTPFWSGFGRNATVLLIATLAGVWLATVFSRDVRAGVESPLFDALSLHRPAVERGQVWRLVTAPLVYRSEALLPLLFGAYALYFTGTAVEAVLGFRGLLGLFASGSLVATAAQVGVWQVAPAAGGDTGYGPAGGLLAVLVAYAVLHRDARILLFFVVPIPAWAFALVWAAAVLFGRIGGVYAPPALLLSAAAAAVWVQTRGTGVGGWPRGPRLKLFRPRPARSVDPRDDTPVLSRPAAARVTDEQLEAQIDRILEKVSDRGQESLTDEERAILVRGSEAYRRRRGKP